MDGYLSIWLLGPSLVSAAIGCYLAALSVALIVAAAVALTVGLANALAVNLALAVALVTCRRSCLFPKLSWIGTCNEHCVCLVFSIKISRFAHGLFVTAKVAVARQVAGVLMLLQQTMPLQHTLLADAGCLVPVPLLAVGLWRLILCSFMVSNNNPFPSFCTIKP